jgi:SNF2 family DNA or RNA helicase
MAVFTPRAPQRVIRDFALSQHAAPRINIFASPGMGKTSEGYDIFESLRLVGEVNRCLVLAPKRVAVSTWPKERSKWAESFGHLKVAAAIGTPAQRVAALASQPDILCINYDNIEWLLKMYEGVPWPYDMVMADESTRLKGLRVSFQRRKRGDGSWGEPFLVGQGSSRAKALADIAHTKVRCWINLTGSPAPNGLQDLWGQQWFVDGGRRLGNSFKAFTDRWFRNVSREDGYTKLEPLRYAQAEIEEKMRECSVTIDARDWFDLDEVIEHHIYVDLPPSARKHYREIEKELFTQIEQEEIEVFNAGSKSNKCLQIGNGAVIFDTESGQWLPVHDEKIEALQSLVEETTGANLLVSYQFKADKARILKAFPQAVVLDDNPETIDRWNRGEIRMLLCHPQSAGHGLDLQYGGWILVDYSSGWNLEYDEQVIERIGPMRQMQAGFKRSVFRYRIVARDTIEEYSVIPRLKSKSSVQEALKAAMKVRQGR